ncbi:MAG: flagellar motor switch protein FliN [Planctomycetota bacterium]|jgi:flagellar motor switch protein FliN/FliY
MTENEQPAGEPQQQADDWAGAAELAQAGAELASAAIQPVAFGQLGQGVESGDSQNLDLLLDVEIPISVEVGRAQMSLEDVLKLVPGSVIALDKKAEEPVDLRVNGKLVARGEVVLVDDVYGLRVTQIVDAAGRIESLR